MGSSFIYSSAHIGLEATPVTVEADISSGLPKFTIVGLPDTAVSESRDRVRSAIKNSGLSFPRTRVTVNLAPADVKKQGPSYDLPIALALLSAAGTIHLNNTLKNAVFLGELALNGEVRPVNGALLCAIMAKETGKSALVLSEQNAQEAGLVSDLVIHPIRSLRELIEYCENETALPVLQRTDFTDANATRIGLAMEDVKGQEYAKRAIEIAAAGGHNILLSGPPGSGKTMLARAVPSILPDLTFQEALEITKIHSVAGTNRLHNGLIRERPFRSPHHSSSSVSLIGGGTWPKPGEVSLAHRGVLFLDEFPEFPRGAIENLRQPLEDGVVTISRAAGTLEFPAQFMLVAAMNPCPCGFVSDPTKACVCTPNQIIKYQQKISGPLMDRIDLAIEVPRVDFDKLTGDMRGESSQLIRARVQAARNVQHARYKETSIHTNAELSSRMLETVCALPESCRELIRSAVDRLQLSARAYTRVLKVARTIADLDQKDGIELSHLSEALQYRPRARE